MNTMHMFVNSVACDVWFDGIVWAGRPETTFVTVEADTIIELEEKLETEIVRHDEYINAA